MMQVPPLFFLQSIKYYINEGVGTVILIIKNNTVVPGQSAQSTQDPWRWGASPKRRGL